MRTPAKTMTFVTTTTAAPTAKDAGDDGYNNEVIDDNDNGNVSDGSVDGGDDCGEMSCGRQHRCRLTCCADDGN